MSRKVFLHDVVLSPTSDLALFVRKAEGCQFCRSGIRLNIVLSPLRCSKMHGLYM